MDTKAIGKKIKDMRLSKGETQQDLADAIGVSKMAISKYELGQMVPGDEVKINIARHFEKSVEEIFFTHD